jgi:cyanamide hydratase
MSDGTKNQELSAHGWTAVPRSQAKLIADLENPQPANIVVDDVKLPDSEVARKTYEYAKKELPEKTFNHSMRVYYYGTYQPLGFFAFPDRDLVQYARLVTSA